MPSEDPTIEEREEAYERQLAELEFISSAYSPQEAWVVDDVTNHDGLRVVFRLLHLPVVLVDCSETIPPVLIELSLKMPAAYPVCSSSILVVNAIHVSSPSNPQYIRKASMSALPKLVATCQTTASEYAESEAVWPVLNRADEWIESEWVTILDEHKCSSSSTSKAKASGAASDNGVKLNKTLGRIIMYSHHIIANSKRKALASLTSEYKLGGYAKIGWPGVIIIEGLESSCQHFVDEIKSMRWQHLSVRAAEQQEIPQGGDIDSFRQLPAKFQELGEDDLSLLAKYCRAAGLEHMFLMCMKINDDRNANSDAEQPPNIQFTVGDGIRPCHTYGTLIHVDHMNDGKGYRKWLRKACESLGCRLLIKQCYISQSSTRPMIYVGIFGDSDSVKQVMKRWRTSRVDVDSKNKPCLERMMTVLVEGNLDVEKRGLRLAESFDDEKRLGCSLDELCLLLGTISKNWTAILRDRHERLL